MGSWGWLYYSLYILVCLKTDRGRYTPPSKNGTKLRDTNLFCIVAKKKEKEKKSFFCNVAKETPTPWDGVLSEIKMYVVFITIPFGDVFITIPILPLSVCLFHKCLSLMTNAVYWWDVVCDGVKNLEWFPPVHKTKPVTWSAWISCIATISLSSVVTLYFLLCSSSASPDLLWSLSSYTFSFIFESATPEICRSFFTLLLKSFSPSATRSTDLHVFSHSLRNYQFHHYLYLQFSTFSAFYCSHLQAFPILKCKCHKSRTVPLFSFLSLIPPQMFVIPKREN